MKERNERNEMKRKSAVKLVDVLLCIVILCMILTGCGNGNGTDAQQENDPTGTNSEDIVVSTDFGDLHYPERWREYVTIRQEQNDDTITVAFETESEGKTYELFEVLIGDDTSDVIGSLTDAAGAQRNVYLHVEELSENSGLKENEQTRFYAMQEDLNYLIDHLK